MDEPAGQRLILKESPGRGRGVFAGQDFETGDLIERTPVLVLPAEQRLLVASTLLKHYYFRWADYKGVVAIALGYGSLYNHSRTPKAEWRPDVDNNYMEYVAVEPIAAGEEITINYGNHTFDSTPRWFEPDGPNRYFSRARLAIGVGAVVAVWVVWRALGSRRRGDED